MEKLYYPAIFEEEGKNGFSVFFPDVKGCNTCGKNMDDAYEMAEDALGLMLSCFEDEKKQIPVPSNPEQIKTKPGQKVVLIAFDLQDYRKRKNGKAVKKTLSIPQWLDEEAKQRGINFSQVLQDALKDKMGVS